MRIYCPHAQNPPAYNERLAGKAWERGYARVVYLGWEKCPFREVSSIQAVLPFLRTFGTNGGLQLPEAQLVGRMLLQRLATGALTSVKQATDYSQGL